MLQDTHRQISVNISTVILEVSTSWIPKREVKPATGTLRVISQREKSAPCSNGLCDDSRLALNSIHAWNNLPVSVSDVFSQLHSLLPRQPCLCQFSIWCQALPPILKHLRDNTYLELRSQLLRVCWVKSEVRRWGKYELQNTLFWSILNNKVLSNF